MAYSYIICNFEKFQVTTTTVEAIKIQIHPPIDLSYQLLEPISLLHGMSTLKCDEDENEESYTVVSNGCDKATFRIKMELKDEDDSMDDEFCGDGNYIFFNFFLQWAFTLYLLIDSVVV